MNEEQAEELEALRSIYDSRLVGRVWGVHMGALISLHSLRVCGG